MARDFTFWLFFMVLSSTCFSQPNYALKYKSFPFSHSEGITGSISVYTYHSSCTVKISDDGVLYITPKDSRSPFLDDVYLTVWFDKFEQVSKNEFLRKNRLLIPVSCVESTPHLSYVGSDIKEMSQELGTKPSFKSADLHFRVRKNGTGTLRIGYNIALKKQISQECSFSGADGIVIHYVIAAFMTRDEFEWEQTRNGSLQEWCDYLKSEKPFASEARLLIKQQEDRDWEVAKRTGTIEGYQKFLEKYVYCQCSHKYEAENKIREIRDKAPKPTVPLKAPTLDEEQKLIEAARGSGLIEKYNTYLDYVAQKGMKGKFVQEAKDSIIMLSPIELEGGISPPDEAGWQILKFRNLLKPLYDLEGIPSDGIDNSRFISDRVLRIQSKACENCVLKISDGAFPWKIFSIELNNLLVAQLDADSMTIRLFLDKGVSPYRVELIDLESGNVAWSKDNVRPGTMVIDKSKEFAELQGDFELLVYEEGKNQPYRFSEPIHLERKRANILLPLLIVFFLSGILVLIYLIWKKRKRKQAPWFADRR